MYEYKGVIAKIVDADTLDIKVDLGFQITVHERFRIARIDAWEVRGKEREKGLVAKAYVEGVMPIGTEVVIVTNKDKGKYGRYIAEIFFGIESANLSDELVRLGHAEYVKY
jgi:micrococcal nuclease